MGGGAVDRGIRRGRTLLGSGPSATPPSAPTMCASRPSPRPDDRPAEGNAVAVPHGLTPSPMADDIGTSRAAWAVGGGVVAVEPPCRPSHTALPPSHLNASYLTPHSMCAIVLPPLSALRSNRPPTCIPASHYWQQPEIVFKFRAPKPQWLKPQYNG